MKFYDWLITFSLASTLALLSTAALAAKSGRIDDMSGAVWIMSIKGDRDKAREGRKLRAGDTVETGARGHAVLKFEDGQLIVLQPNSAFVIEDYQFSKKESRVSNILFSLLKGGLRAVTGQIAKRWKSAFQLKVASVTMRVRGTDFAVVRKEGPAQELYARVYAGAISVANDGGTAIIKAGDTVFVRSQGGRLTVVPDVQVPELIFREIEKYR